MLLSQDRIGALPAIRSKANKALAVLITVRITAVVAAESPPSSGEPSQIFFGVSKQGQNPWTSAKIRKPLSNIKFSNPSVSRKPLSNIKFSNPSVS